MESQKTAMVGKLKTLANVLTVAMLAGFLIPVIAIFFNANKTGVPAEKDQLPLVVAVFSISMLCFLIFYILLGIQAVRLKKRPVLWVGLALLSAPVGPLVACFWIRGDTKKACNEILFPREEMNRIAEEGDTACQAGRLKSANPYRAPNTPDENVTFANYWDRGYDIAAKRHHRSRTQACSEA